MDWFSVSEGDVASAILDRDRDDDFASSSSSWDNRIRSQLSAHKWNSRVMANKDKLSVDVDVVVEGTGEGGAAVTRLVAARNRKKRNTRRKKRNARRRG
jgi:hypothetical protein